MGSLARHRHVVHPLPVRRRTSIPLATASNPFGTVIRNVYDAVSLGWSLTGNHVSATCGCPTTRAPSWVWMNPDRPPNSSSVSGTPSYLTTVTKRVRSRIPRAGVILSSPPSRLHLARRPLTVIDRTVSPTKSRLYLERFWVARAVMVATPVRTSVEGSYRISRR
jgi:hypothetical protein